MADLRQLSADLVQMEGEAVAVGAEVSKAMAGRMAQQASAMSSPYYGVVVKAVARPTPSGATVAAVVIDSGGPGRVHGGSDAVRRELLRRWQVEASDAGSG